MNEPKRQVNVGVCNCHKTLTQDSKMSIRPQLQDVPARSSGVPSRDGKSLVRSRAGRKSEADHDERALRSESHTLAPKWMPQDGPGSESVREVKRTRCASDSFVRQKQEQQRGR